MASWYKLKQEDTLPTPCLLVYPHRIKQNILEMIRAAGDVSRLRPHVKTHKCPKIVELQLQAGITKFKCATVAEAEMLANCGVVDVLLAYQPVGPHIQRFLDLITTYPHTEFSTLVDHSNGVDQLNNGGKQINTIIPVFMDLDVGMHRTGISPGPAALELADHLASSENLNFRGWHVYDGHLRQKDLGERKQAADLAFEQVEEMRAKTKVSTVVAGGSPTFALHAAREGVELSPGTTLLWDQGYSQNFADLNFLPAALVLTRIISKPAGDLICLDLGHKAIASEMPHPRVQLEGIEVVEFTTHSEEHLVVRSPDAPNYQIGDVLYGIPMHICPTSALHQEMVAVESGEVVQRWPVAARDRRLKI